MGDSATDSAAENPSPSVRDALASDDRDASISHPDAATPETNDAAPIRMSDALAQDSSSPQPGMVAVFLAQGHLGRTTLSCDDGKSWTFNHSIDDSVRCFENNFDCDHNEDAGRGIVFGKGRFFATWGWGHPAKLSRSDDGKSWSPVLTHADPFAGLAYGAGIFAANAGVTLLSQDGDTWHDGAALNIDMNYRSIDFIDYDGGRFVVTGESGERRAIVWSKDGKEWVKATTRPDGCGGYYRGLGFGKGITVLASGKGHVCTSKDGGQSWDLVQLDTYLGSSVVWTGTQFLVWNGSKLYRSPDGLAWSNENTVPPDISIGAVARAENGTLVASNDGWLAWYEKQKFYRSTDGKNWEVLDRAQYTGSHPINFIRAGVIQSFPGCGAP